MNAANYLSKLETALWPLNETERGDFVREMQGHIDELRERHPDRSEEELVAGLTPPEELAAELLAEEEEEKSEACPPRDRNSGPETVTITMEDEENDSGAAPHGPENREHAQSRDDAAWDSDDFRSFSKMAGRDAASKLKTALKILSGIGSAFGSAGGGDIDIQKDIDGADLTSLHVRLFSGDLRLRPSADGAFHITARGLESEDQLDIRVEEGALCAREQSGFRSGIDTVEISIPTTAAELDLSTASGDMDIERINAAVGAHAKSGNINARACPGALLAESTSGDITLEDCGSASASSSSGDIEAMDIHGDFAGRSASGELRIAGVEGRLGLESSSGDIDVESQGGAFAAKSISGDISASFKGVFGGAEASSVSGDIRLRFEEEPDAGVEAFSRSGNIRAGDREEEGREIRQKLGKGGPALKAMTVSGDIDINW